MVIQSCVRPGGPAGPQPSPWDGEAILEAARTPREPVCILEQQGSGRLAAALERRWAAGQVGHSGWSQIGTVPPLYPEWLGGRTFCEAHRVRFPYVVGEMANGLTSTQMVIAAARAGLVGFFGAAGLTPRRIEAAVVELTRELGGSEQPFGANLIHSPNEPDLEDTTVELYLRHRVRWVSASAFMRLTPALVRFTASGLYRDLRGRVRRHNWLMAKVSRPEIARLFMSPAPRELLQALVGAGRLTSEQAELAASVPLAEDITVEADSGGHTDNRPLGVIYPVIAALRDELTLKHGYQRAIRLGAAGGLGTPDAVAAAFALGAAYVLTGSVNQTAVECELSQPAQELLAQASPTDVMMAPAADMFELGVKVQVLRRGTLFGPRALHLYQLYQRHSSLEELPAEERARLETELFRLPLGEVEAQTERFWAERDPRQNERAARDAKHRMALCFRWYLGMASRWAISGDVARAADFQIWCGPAIGAFNQWACGSFLEQPARRTVAQIGLNLLEGAAAITRAQQLRTVGVPVPAVAFRFRPRPLLSP